VIGHPADVIRIEGQQMEDQRAWKRRPSASVAAEDGGETRARKTGMKKEAAWKLDEMRPARRRAGR
jgi:hypothetical protein